MEGGQRRVMGIGAWAHAMLALSAGMAPLVQATAAAGEAMRGLGRRYVATAGDRHKGRGKGRSKPGKWYRGSRSKYSPHQGAAECLRRRCGGNALRRRMAATGHRWNDKRLCYEVGLDNLVRQLCPPHVLGAMGDHGNA